MRHLFWMMIFLVACQSPQEEEKVRQVRVYQVTSPEEARTRNFSGAAKASEESMLSFRVRGKITAILVDVGDPVDKGALLATLDPLDYQLEMQKAEAQLKEAQANARNAIANYDRVRALYETQTASRADLDQARADFESTRAAVVAAEKGLNLTVRELDYTLLRAPEKGAIAEKFAEVNENVLAQEPVLKMVSGTRPEVDVQIPEVLIGEIEVGMPIMAKFPAIDQTLPGRVIHVGVATTGTSTTYPVTVLIEDLNHRVRSGMTADISFKLPQPDDSVYIPSQAVGEDLQGSYVFVVTDWDGRFGIVERQSVVVGELFDDELEIRRGLQGGEWVIVAGIRNLKPGQRVSIYKGKGYGELLTPPPKVSAEASILL